MDGAFLKAISPPRFRCLGLQLDPLTVGHLFLLREQCQEVLDYGDYSIGKLAMAAFCCSRPYTESRKDLRAWWARFVFAWWGRRCAKLDFQEERNAFELYLTSNQELPTIWTGGDDNPPLRELGAPLEFRLLVFLMGQLHYSEADALNAPVIRVNMLWASVANIKGVVELTTPSREALLKFAREMDLKNQRQ